LRRYVRAYASGACYFFTVNLANRQGNTLLVDRVDLLRDVIRTVRARHPFSIDAMVVMPDHLHSVWTLPTDDTDFSTRWALIKSGFSRRIPSIEKISASRSMKGERGLWQRRFWEHMIRDDDDFARHIDYIHYNPVKHGMVLRATDWPHSSIHRYVRQGVVSADWAADVDVNVAGAVWD
jgi:putative transposase